MHFSPSKKQRNTYFDSSIHMIYMTYQKAVPELCHSPRSKEKDHDPFVLDPQRRRLALHQADPSAEQLSAGGDIVAGVRTFQVLHVINHRHV